MKQPKWKIWLSYFVELHLESIASPFNPHLYVSLRQGRYQLSTATAVYSFGDLYSNFFRAFQALDLDRLSIRKVLLLGLGLGSIPLILEKNFGKSYQYTAVEIDEAVLYLANKYSLDELKSPIELIHADARVYVVQEKNRFELICMDIFLGDAVPSDFERPGFSEALRDLLTPGGVLLYNRLAATSQDKRRSMSFYEQTFRTVFPQPACLDVGANFIFVSREDALR